MKGTESQIQLKFLKLLNKYKIDEINVDLLCSAVNIKRQTFYYHYKNIYDVIYSIFYTKKLEATNPKIYDRIVDDCLGFLFSDENFYREINESNAKDVLLEFSISFLYRSLLIYLNRYKLLTDSKKEIARFVASSLAHQTLYYFAQPELTKREIKVKLNVFFNAEMIDKLVNNYRNFNV